MHSAASAHPLSASPDSALPVSSSRAVAQLLQRPPSLTHPGAVETFVLSYIYFEALLRILLEAYHSREGGVAPSGRGARDIRVDVVRRAVAHFKVGVSREVIDFLLESRRRSRGSKSCRNLRNELVHGWSWQDAEEVLNRRVELGAALAEATGAIARLGSKFSRS